MRCVVVSQSGESIQVVQKPIEAYKRIVNTEKESDENPAPLTSDTVPMSSGENVTNKADQKEPTTLQDALAASISNAIG